MNWKPWLHSIVAAAISAAAGSITASIVDPEKFNMTVSGLQHLGAFAILNAILAVALVLKQSPLPPEINQRANPAQPKEQ